MAVAKSENREPSLHPCISYKVPNLQNSILDTDQTSNLTDRYVLGKPLGWGQFGVISECFDRLTRELLACKSIAKYRVADLWSIKLEIEIMIRLSGHPYIVDLKAVYEEEDYVHLVMELCAGGELFHHIKECGKFPESEARVIFKQLMEVVTYCHDKGVIHRDLKPENILLTTKASPLPIKLADFGLATYIEPGQRLNGKAGSPFYIAPEVLAGGYDQAADVWSAGVVLYILLSALPPFFGETKSKIFNAVREANLQFPSNPWDQISDSSKELIRGMLCTDPSQRLTAQQVLDHAWMKESFKCSKQCLESDVARASTRSLFMARDQDISFGTGSPIFAGVQSPPATCSSSFSSFVEVPPSPSFASYSYPLPSIAGSSSLEFCTPVSFPSFTFFSPPGPLAQQGNCSFNFTAIDPVHQVIRMETFLVAGDDSSSFGDVAEREREEHNAMAVKRMDDKSWVRTAGRRNNTIGVGEFDQLSLVAAESVIRWASCTHLATASLRFSLVC